MIDSRYVDQSAPAPYEDQGAARDNAKMFAYRYDRQKLSNPPHALPALPSASPPLDVVDELHATCVGCLAADTMCMREGSVFCGTCNKAALIPRM